MTYENENPYAGYDSNGASPQELLARLTALQSHISSTVTRLGEAETKISQNADEIDLRVTKDGVIAAINLSSEEITIDASKITLRGAVTVLSDITGELGTITAGDIYGVNIHGGYISSATNIDIGRNLTIGKLPSGSEFFSDCSISFGNFGDITVYDYGGYGSELYFNVANVNFSNTNVVGLPSYASEGYVDSQVWSGMQSVMDWVTQNFVHK